MNRTAITSFKRLTAGLALVSGAATAAIFASAGASNAAPACPSGSDGSKLYLIKDFEMSKACFRWDDRKAMIADLNVDGISGYVYYAYYNSGWKDDEWWDSDGADNGWEYSPSFAANRRYTVGIQACAYDRDGKSGRHDYGCSAQRVIQPQTSV